MAPDSFQLILLTKHMCLNIFLISQTVRHYCLLSPIHPSSHPAIQPSIHRLIYHLPSVFARSRLLRLGRRLGVLEPIWLKSNTIWLHVLRGRWASLAHQSIVLQSQWLERVNNSIRLVPLFTVVLTINCFPFIFVVLSKSSSSGYLTLDLSYIWHFVGVQVQTVINNMISLCNPTS